jgi:hypothetical protein
LIRGDQIAELIQKRQEQDVAQLSRALNEFRALHQQPNSRREWDLSDPDYLRKDKPARVHDDDPRCGISGMQKFDGEDLNQKARAQFMGEQHREWCEQQAHEKDQARRRQEEADRLYELKMRELDQRAMELQQAEEQCRQALDCAQADYNHALVRNSLLPLQNKTGKCKNQLGISTYPTDFIALKVGKSWVQESSSSK